MSSPPSLIHLFSSSKERQGNTSQHFIKVKQIFVYLQPSLRYFEISSRQSHLFTLPLLFTSTKTSTQPAKAKLPSSIFISLQASSFNFKHLYFPSSIFIESFAFFSVSPRLQIHINSLHLKSRQKCVFIQNSCTTVVCIVWTGDTTVHSVKTK